MPIVLALPFRLMFQFHKGTIRTSLHRVVQLIKLCFNSIKVRLEQMVARFTAHAPVFQFHKGTIRTGLMVYGAYRGIRFQFHKGTIRTAVIYVTHLLSPVSIP